MCVCQLYFIDKQQVPLKELVLFLNEVLTDCEAIKEYNAQINLMSCEGGIPFDERWNGFNCRLMKGKEILLEDNFIFEW